jgi:hypothetical protein
MRMKITIQIEANLLREVRKLAAEKEVPVGTLLAKRLEQIVHNREIYERARESALIRLHEGLDLQWTPSRFARRAS